MGNRPAMIADIDPTINLLARSCRCAGTENESTMIRFTSGDLLQAGQQYIAQGVAEGNQEGLGTGLALKISRKWPDAQSAFKKHARLGTFRGGSIWVYPPSGAAPGFVYMATQPDMYHATLPFLRKSIRNLAKWSVKNDIASVALPKIGAGLGKLSWFDEVKPLLEQNLRDCPCDFVVYEDFTSAMETGLVSL